MHWCVLCFQCLLMLHKGNGNFVAVLFFKAYTTYCTISSMAQVSCVAFSYLVPPVPTGSPSLLLIPQTQPRQWVKGA